MGDSGSSKKRKSIGDGKNNETQDGSQNSTKQRRISGGQSSQGSPSLSPSTPKTRRQKLTLGGASPGTWSTSQTSRDSGVVEGLLSWKHNLRLSQKNTDENEQQQGQDVEAKELSNYRPKDGPIYGSISFQKECIIKRLKALSESPEHTIEMGLEMADGVYLMQIMNISTPIEGIEKAWQTAHRGATLLHQGELLLKECQATLKSSVLPALRSGS